MNSSGGNLAEYIVSEIAKRGVQLASGDSHSVIPAAWRIISVEMDGQRRDIGVEARGCSTANICAFCFSLFSRYRVSRPSSNDSDSNFVFRIADKAGRFLKTSEGLVISFTDLGMTLTVGETDGGVHIGFADHGTREP